jgi:hypothetical protein
VRAIGGRVMLLVSDNETFHDDYNYDPRYGMEKADIPTVIIKQSDGNLISSLIRTNPVTMEINLLSLQNESYDIYLEIFLRSDDAKTLHFFKEFGDIYRQICKVKLTTR